MAICKKTYGNGDDFYKAIERLINVYGKEPRKKKAKSKTGPDVASLYPCIMHMHHGRYPWGSDEMRALMDKRVADIIERSMNRDQKTEQSEKNNDTLKRSSGHKEPFVSTDMIYDQFRCKAEMSIKYRLNKSMNCKGERNMPATDTLLIGYDFSHGVDKTVLVVGRKRPNGTVEIVNTLQDEEANELYKKLTTKKVKENKQ
jgi:hypothetical protein